MYLLYKLLVFALLLLMLLAIASATSHPSSRDTLKRRPDRGQSQPPNSHDSAGAAHGGKGSVSPLTLVHAAGWQ